MLIAVIVLVVTNFATAAALVYLRLRPPAQPGPDARVAATLNRGVPASSSASRRVISIEVLNALELAGTRGRWAGLAGNVAPGLVKRIVYDETIKILRVQLVEQGVQADVRLHQVGVS